MRIAFDHRIFASQEYGGVSRYCTRLVQELDATGHDVRVVAPLYVNGYLAELPRRLVHGRHLSASRLTARLARRVDGLMAKRLLAAALPDIVHETYYAPAGATPRGARTVLTVHDMIHEKFRASFPAHDPVATWKAAAVARADLILCVSESTRADLVALHPSAAARARVTLLGFDTAPASAAAPVRGRPFILFVGQRQGYKNFAALLDGYAASGLRRDFDLLALGGGRFTPAEQAAIAAHGLQGRVRRLAADEAALHRHYAAAAAFAYPSLYEGFGIPPLEAMAAGTPVVAVPGGSVPEICGNAAEYAVGGGAEALGAALERVLGSPTRSAELVAAGRARLAKFSWTRCAAQTAAAYRSLV